MKGSYDMKKIKTYIGMMAALLTLLAACSDSMVDYSVPSQSEADATQAHFTISVPTFSQVTSRVANFAHEGITKASDMKLLCFDQDGYFLGLATNLNIETVAETEIKTDGGTEKKNISATIPGGTARIHLMANVTKENTVSSITGDAIDFDKAAEWTGRHENNLMTSFDNKNCNQQHDKMVYWGYVKKNSAAEMKEYLTSDNVEYNVIHLLRNRAKIEVSWDGNQSGITNIRYAIGNIMTHGTVAPFNRDKDKLAFPQTNLLTDAAAWKAECTYVTPSQDPTRWPSEGETFSVGENEMWPNSNNLPMQYTFEQENTADKPLKVMLEVTYNDNDRKWFQILIQNDGEQIPIKRNHLYKITIERLSKNLGYKDASSAFKGTPANNPWIKVDDIIQEISDGTYTMDITNGTYVMLTKDAANTQQTINFTYKGDDDLTTDNFHATWTMNKDFTKLDESTKKLPEPTVTYAGGTGSISYNVGDIDAETIKQATIRLTDKAHGLTRYIHLYSIQNMDFGFNDNISMGTAADAEGELTFTIPEGYPKELFPIEIEIASNDVNSTGSDVKVSSTEDVDDGAKWNCWFVSKYTDTSVIGKQQTIKLQNVRKVTSGSTGKLYIRAKYYDGGYKTTKAKEVTINYAD